MAEETPITPPAQEPQEPESPAAPTLSELLAGNPAYQSQYQTMLDEQKQQWQAEARQQMDALRRDSAIDLALAGSKARNAKAARALLDLDRVTFADGKLSGLDEQVAQLRKEYPWLFGPDTTADTGGEHGQGGSAGQDGVEAAFARLNPGLKL